MAPMCDKSLMRDWSLTLKIFFWWLLLAGSLVCMAYGFSSLAYGHGSSEISTGLAIGGTVGFGGLGFLLEKCVLRPEVKSYKNSMTEKSKKAVYGNLAVFLCLVLSIFFGLAIPLTSMNTIAMVVLSASFGVLSLTLFCFFGSCSIIGTDTANKKAAERKERLKARTLEQRENIKNKLLLLFDGMESTKHKEQAREIFINELEKYGGNDKRIFNALNDAWRDFRDGDTKQLTIQDSILDKMAAKSNKRKLKDAFAKDPKEKKAQTPIIALEGVIPVTRGFEKDFRDMMSGHRLANKMKMQEFEADA